jgi:hypothetical protein
MSGDLIEDISGVTPTRARMPSDMVLDIRKPSTPQPVPLPGMAVTPPGLPSPADTIPSAAQIVALPGQLKDLAITAAPYAISTIGGVGGAALGTFLGGPVGGLFGESIGSLGARKLNVALGLEEPGLTGDIIAGASPAAMRGVLGVGKRLFRNLPGTSPVAHEVAQEALEQVPGKLAPATAATDLWQEAAKHHPPVPMPEVDQTAAKIMREQLRMQPTSRQGELLKRAEDLQDLIRTHGGNVPLDLMDEHRKEYGIRIAEAAGSKDWRLEKGLKELYGAFHRDLDTAAARATPGAEGLQSAIQATRREKAVEDLALLWGPGRGIAPAVGGEHMQVNGRGILRQFEKMVAEDEVFAKSFAPGELKKIRETLKDVARMTTRPATNVSGLGSRVMPYVAHGTVLGGALKGNMPIMAIGMAMEAAPYAIAEAIQTPLGRAAIRRAFQEGGGHLTAAGIALINESLREQPEGTVRATIRQGEGQAPAAPPRLSLPGMGGQ